MLQCVWGWVKRFAWPRLAKRFYPVTKFCLRIGCTLLIGLKKKMKMWKNLVTYIWATTSTTADNGPIAIRKSSLETLVQVSRTTKQRERWRIPFQRKLRIVSWNKAVPYFMFLALFIIKIKLQEEFPSGAPRLVKEGTTADPVNKVFLFSLLFIFSSTCSH